jgi:hypothetical protein
MQRARNRLARHLSANGASSSKAWGIAPGLGSESSPSAEGATHGTRMNRAFSAGVAITPIPAAMPQAKMNTAPLALSTRRTLTRSAFALYEVLLGLLIFAVGIIALGRAVNNCMNASALSADDARVREILANRMVEIETTPGQPDKAKESKINTGFGIVKLVQKAAPQEMKEEDGKQLTGIIRVTLTANWTRGGSRQSKAIAFYVYRL